MTVVRLSKYRQGERHPLSPASRVQYWSCEWKCSLSIYV